MLKILDHISSGDDFKIDAFVSMIQNVRWVILYLKTTDLAAVRRVLYPIVNGTKPWMPNVEIKVEFE